MGEIPKLTNVAADSSLYLEGGHVVPSQKVSYFPTYNLLENRPFF